MEEKLSDLNINELVRITFLRDYYKVEETLFLPEGKNDWPTWCVLIHRESVFKDYLYFILSVDCESIKVIHIGESIDSNQWKSTLSQNYKEFYYWYKLEKEYHVSSLSVNEGFRLYTFLKERDIELFEAGAPTPQSEPKESI